jgi:hypothetical protein
MNRYRVVYARWTSSKFIVQDWKWYRPWWRRCIGLRLDIFDNVEAVKASIPLYNKGAAYWVGTMVDMTKERIGVKVE